MQQQFGTMNCPSSTRPASIVTDDVEEEDEEEFFIRQLLQRQQPSAVALTLEIEAGPQQDDHENATDAANSVDITDTTTSW